jgi:hypothetical protein
MLLVALAFEPLALCAALEFPEGELARVSLSRDIAFRAEFNNDSYSVFPGDDWDDFRTFGFFAGVAANEWAMEITADAFTARGNEEREGTRVDEVYAVVSRRLSAGSVRVGDDLRADAEFRIGLGALGTGNFGSSGLQQAIHTAYGCDRKTPWKESAPDSGWIGVGNAVILARIDDDAFPFFVATSGEASYSGFARIRAFAGFDWRFGNLGSKVYGGFSGSRGYGTLGGEAFSATLDTETGWYAGFTARANPIEAGFSWNARANRQSGRIALVFGGKQRPSDRLKGGSDDNRAKPLNVDFRIVPLDAGIRLRKTIFTGAYIGSIAIGAEGGPMNWVRPQGDRNRHFRYEQAYLGFELAKGIQGFAEVYALAAGGIREETEKTVDAEEARLIERAVSPVFSGEIGARVYPPLPGHGRSRWGVGISGCANLSDTLIPGWKPFFQLYLSGSNR